MKRFIILSAILFTSLQFVYNQTDIATARGESLGSTVTIRGIAINGDELGRIKYIQDATAGIAVYSASLDDLKAGTDITITGVLKNYNNLLEIDPVSSSTENSTGNPLPDPAVLTPDQLGEAFEGQLVQIKNAVFKDAGGVFQASTNYAFTADGVDGVIRISSYSGSNPNEGKIIPSGEITITGVLSQYFTTYQILVRYTEDIAPASSINLASTVTMSNLSTTGFSLSWDTDVVGSTEFFWGYTPDLELGQLDIGVETLNHTIELAGAVPSTIVYVQPFSVLNEDTTKAPVGVYITQSESSGDMKAYFNREVNTSVSTGVDAEYLNEAIDDTLIQYINRAKYSIDFTIYNFNNDGLSNISDALNAAHNRGVIVRAVYDSNTGNLGIDDLDAGIGKMASPEDVYPIYGIMHNKFIVFDANSTDPNDPIVWTGATNLTDGQINIDPNNVIIIQDKSLALTYWLEFNEMFGTHEAMPDATASRFGPDKTDNTAHHFIIDGKNVECYFSPSDGTNQKIINTIKSADSDLSIATMLITRTDLGYAVDDAADAGVTTKFLTNNEGNCYEPIVDLFKTSLQENFRESGESGIMHHKYMIVDQGNIASDPTLLTGCHNWSSSAEQRNDENTLIIHDATMANIYYQEFVARFENGLLIIDAPVCTKDFNTMSEGTSTNFSVTANDDIPSAYSLEITRQPENGSAAIENDFTITYTPDIGFNAELDTIYYKVCLTVNPSLCDSSYAVVYVNLPVGIDDNIENSSFKIYPNPAEDRININFEGGKTRPELIQVLDLTGKIVYETLTIQNEYPLQINSQNLKSGIYLVKIYSGNKVFSKKIIKK